ncbi:MAG: PIG-L family deacetylase [Vicinamibacterales bacterium]
MNRTRAAFIFVVSAALAALGPASAGHYEVSAQLRVRPIDLEDGAVALGLTLRRLNSTAVFMQATAHPDDENNALHVYLNRGQGVRTILATATRGDGGQNEIGPELYDPLAVLRTEELEAMHRFDATEQYFTRAIDFGYSFSIEETMQKWGRDEIISDYVRLIRMTRPDVVVGMNPTGTAGGLHHQTSGLLSREAFKAAGDPARYPEQIREGLMPWQPRKYYYPAGGPGGGGRGQAPAPTGPLPLGALKAATFDVAGFDPLLGRTYVEVGTEERGMHKSQAMGQLLALPSGRSQQRYLLMDSSVPATPGDEPSLFYGIDTTIPGLASLAGSAPPPSLVSALRAIADHVSAAQKQFDLDGPFAAAPPIVAGLGAVRTLRQQLSTMGLAAEARFNLDARLKTKEDQLTGAALLAHGLRVEVLADDGVVVPGQDLRVSISIGDRGRPVTVSSVALDGFSTPAACPSGPLEVGAVYRCDAATQIPATARVTKPYWKALPKAARYEFEPDAPFGLPFRPTPFTASFTLTAGGTELHFERPVEFRYEGQQLEGEKRIELTVVHRLALRATPPIAIVPAGRGATAAVNREVRVTVANHAKGATNGQVRMDSPAGWTTTPPVQPVNFTREDEAQTVRFVLRPAAKTPLGQYNVKSVATVGAQTFETGFQAVEYPHIRRRHLEIAASVAVKVMDVRLAPSLTIGYVMGTGDEIPAALRGLGATVELLDGDELGWGDLSRYDAIFIGVRAYDSRDDLRANNKRVLDYAAAGGIVVVQYNRGNTWTQYAPFPARASNTRVTDENGEVQVLASDDPVFHYPNEIGAGAWRNWVQERGTYFIVPDDQRYTDLIQINEPFEHNVGWKKGAFVSANVGKGRWIFVGLGLWRQVAAGTDGAFQLLANLASRGKLPGK